MSLDVTALRSHFPSLQSGIAHFDGPGGTQTPREVGEAIATTLTGPLSNRGTGIASESNSDIAVAEFRSAFADFLGASPQGVVYGRSATQLVYDWSRALAKDWRPGDEVVVSRLDHDSNIRPWIQAAEAVGATVRWIEFDVDTSEIPWSSVEAALSPRTRLVAITGASNLLGTMPPVRRIADAAHAVGALVHVDGVHYAAHHLVDIDTLGADSFVCSPYKFLGPHCAVLAASPELLHRVHPDKLLPSTNEVPERYEFGTLPYEIMAGATAAVNFIADIAPGSATSRRDRLAASWHAIDEHETRLRGVLENGLAQFGDQVVVHSRAADRTPTLLLTMPGRATWDAYEFLATKNVLAPSGSFYAYDAFQHLGTPDEGGLRLGLAPYINDSDVARVLDGLAEFLAR
jgi:cysteine desulfurase family protein (TIGR01976 family)